tara:strand:+ start:1168 stop:1323 length:156 start_codon:yes stop_codon:yes gene_type:complete
MFFVGTVGLIAGLVVGAYFRLKTVKMLRRQLNAAHRRNAFLTKPSEGDLDA